MDFSDFQHRWVNGAAVDHCIKFHGLRHTSATLLIAAGQPVTVVSERLGHADVATTLNTYAHVLPGQQEHAAATISTLLHG